VLVAVWVLLSAIFLVSARHNFSVPGLYYDEAVFGGLAKDFLVNRIHGQHMPDHQTISIAGRPFPLFVQTYLGALKTWMLMPVFKLFGASATVLRASNVFWGLISLLLLSLASGRWFGPAVATMAGLLLVFDPTFLFISVLDWGVAVPSFLCRCACLYFAIRCYQMQKLHDWFLLGLFAGLGFFNKADFAVFLAAIGLAALICYRRRVVDLVKHHSSGLALACLGFAIGGGPMLLKLPRMFALTLSGPHPNAPGEFGVKLKTLFSMYDGTHFYRLMNVGGVFERMYGGASGPKALFGAALVLSLIVLAFVAGKIKEELRALLFLVAATLLITIGVFLLPDAVRIHHAFLVFPLPQLIIALVIAIVSKLGAVQRPLAAIALAIVCFSGLRSIWGTQNLIQATGGRGRWSESLNQFCRENRDRSDLTIVSLDWGFNEQLMFLTEGPSLSEPFWEFNQTLPPLRTDSNYIYLAHPPEYSVLKYDVAYLNQLKHDPNAEITPHFDRESEIAFYSIRFHPPQ
jgi:hypothetical protein